MFYCREMGRISGKSRGGQWKEAGISLRTRGKFGGLHERGAAVCGILNKIHKS